MRPRWWAPRPRARGLGLGPTLTLTLTLTLALTLALALALALTLHQVALLLEHGADLRRDDGLDQVSSEQVSR